MSVVSALGNGFVPFISGRFFDAITSPAMVTILGMIMPLFTALLILWALVQCVTYFVDWKSTILSEKFSNTIWLDYLAIGFGFLLELPMSFHKQNKIGEISNKINVAAGALETIAGRIVIDLAPQLLSIVIALLVAVYLKPLLALFLLLGVIVYILILVRKVKPLAGYQKAYWDHLHVSFGDAYDVVGNTLAIKQSTAEPYEHARMKKSWKDALPLYMRMTMVWGNLNLYQRLTILATQLLIFVASVYYIRAGAMTIGELIAFNAYAAMIFGPFVVIARNWQTIQNGIINIETTEKILRLEPEKYEPARAAAFEVKGGISFKNVSFHYESEKPVLENISFEAKPGEVVALVGESGVGKSTLVDLISGYHFPEEGTIEIDGHDIRTVNLRTLRSKIAVVPQEVVLFNDTIEMNIKYGNFKASDAEVREAARKAHAVEFIEKFPKKWQQIVGERGVKLSVGQKQRVSIARAILRNPAILILDEPTSALDAGSEKIIVGSLEELMRGKTTFIIAHRLSTVRKANKIIVVKNGRIVESGTHQELIEIPGGEYRRLHELQIGLHG
jgi:ATP-binding cassette subfamily B protein